MVPAARQGYREAIHRSRNEVRLHPIESLTQRVRSAGVEVDPTAEVAVSTDYYNNMGWSEAVEAPHRQLVLRVPSEVELAPPPFEPATRHRWCDDALAFTPTISSPAV